jgi:pimeloyl-ACP methyl ester carboxylesterase
MNLVTQFFEGSPASVDLVQQQFEAFLDQIREANPALQFSLLKQDAVSVAIVGRGGELLLANGVFAKGAADHLLDRNAIFRASSAAHGVIVEHAGDESTGGAMAIAYGAALGGRNWQVSDEVKVILARATARVIAVAIRPSQEKGAIEQACQSLGLTPFQSRVVTCVVETASIRKASEVLGIAYASAREAVADALAITGARRLPALVDMLVMLSVGVFPRADRSDDFVQRATGLSLRQLRLAFAIAHGNTREEAAKSIGVSLAVAKKEIDAVHIALDTINAVDVAKRLIEIRMLSYLTCITQSDMRWEDTRPNPIRFERREDGSRIAYCDYGPTSGRPVFVFHSSTTTQSVSRALVDALQKGGYRVLSVDRPGFGQSDMMTAPADSGLGCFDLAARDFSHLCKMLKLSKVSIVTRGAAQVLVALNKLRPDLLERVVLTNPDPHTNEAGKRTGLLGIVKEAFFRRPELIRIMAQLIIAQLTPEKAFQAMQKSFRGSPIDQQIAADPGHFADYYRSVRPFAAGAIDGYVAEQTAFATSSGYETQAGTHHWAVLLGEHDVLHAPAYVHDYWAKIWPDATFHLVEGAGRLLTFSHPEVVVSALKEKTVKRDLAGSVI